MLEESVQKDRMQEGINDEWNKGICINRNNEMKKYVRKEGHNDNT